MVARVGVEPVDLLELEEVAPVPQRSRSGTGDGSLRWDISRHLRARCSSGCRRRAAGRAGRRDRRSTPGRSTTACSTRTGSCSASRSRTATPAPTASPSGCVARGRRRGAVRRTGLQQLPFNTLYQLVAAGGSWRRRAAPAATLLLHPGPARASGSPGSVGRRAHQRVHHRSCSTPGRRSGRRDLLDRLGLPADILPALRRARATSSGPLLPDVAGERRAATPTAPVIAVGSHDTASAVVGVPAGDEPFAVHLLRHLVAGRPRAAGAGAHREAAREAELHQRGRAWTAPSGS